MDLLDVGDGRCGAWAWFMLDVLDAQGFGNSTSVGGVRTEHIWAAAPTVDGKAFGRPYMLVSNWNFGQPTAATTVVSIEGLNDTQKNSLLKDYQYIDITGGSTPGDVYNADKTRYNFVSADVTYVGGNGNAKGPNKNPAALFPDHAAVAVTVGNVATWYDPSYGVIDPGTSEAQCLASVDKQMAGFAVGVTATVKLANGTQVTRYVLLIRKPSSAQTDLTLTYDTGFTS
jgi:hypothetical protein